MGQIPIGNLVPGVGASEPLQKAGAPVAGVSEVQRVTITGTPTGGTFTLSGTNPNTSKTFTTAAIAYNAAASAVVAALVAVLGAGAVTGSGGALPGTPVDVTFAAGFANKNIAQMTATSSLTGGSSPAVAVTTVTPGSAGTLAGRWPAGGLLVDTTNKLTYQNTGTTVAPTPTKVGTQT